MQRWFLALILLICLALGASGAAFRYFSGRVISRGVRGAWCPDVSSLEMENTGLRAYIHGLSSTSTAFVVRDRVLAHVYASYPFGNIQSLEVDRGSANGVRVGMPVVIGDGVLLGQVVKVSLHTSTVRLVGSPDWQISVRIGREKIVGLLTGGHVPSLGMIPADKRIVTGDAVIVADRSLPYGLSLGTIGAVAPNEVGAVFGSASLILPYESRDLTEFFILLWTPDS